MLALIAAVFAPTIGFDFVNWDDGLHVYANPAVLGSGNARDRWLTPSLGYPIPVTVASYSLEHAIAGTSPWLYHLTNLLLHLGVCGWVYLLGRRVGLGRAGASLALLFFGLHPVVAEPVSWVSGRKDLLAAFFGLAATWTFISAAAGTARRARWVALSTLLFALAVFSKPSVLCLPFFWALWRADDGRRPWRSALPAGLVALAAGILGRLGESQVGAIERWGSLWGGIRSSWYALGYHLGLASFVQAPLAKHIPLRMPPPFDPSVDLFPVGVGLLILISFARLGPRQRIAKLGLLFAFAAYLPNSGIVPLVRFSADSYVYLALAGLAWFIGAWVDTVAPLLRRAIRWSVTSATVAALSLASVATASAWSDGVSLWQSVYQRYPDSKEVCLNLGNAYFEKGLPRKALDYYERCSLLFGPDHFAKNRAITLIALGRREQARRLLLGLLAKEPEDPVLLKYLRLLGAEPQAGPARQP